ncbi:hypothetical protein Pint_28846 [Pistacia integerrima]|uniref:Uncharacterized protein n=1 Tax=Pistacia integerrima TaxID=434235 RepID=A0ACC0WZB9_9ROSI|nr:hypothetical protein Pint_28846 [Pistacia integerrima]
MLLSNDKFKLHLWCLISSLCCNFCYNNFQSRRHAALFVFGDSLYDPGNNNFINTSIINKANYPPYGETFFRFPTGRFSDGRLIPDFIAKYAHLPYWKPYLAPGQHEFINGANFASAGACAIADNNPTVKNLHQYLNFIQTWV